VKVVGWAADDSACGFYRIHQPFAALAGRGHDAKSTRVVRGQRLLEDGTQLLVAQRVVGPEPTFLLDVLKRSGLPYLYEIDDLLNRVDVENPVSDFFRTPDVREAFDAAILNAAGITVSTPELADLLGEDYPRQTFTVLPNCLPDYFGSVDFDPTEIQESGPAVVWAGSATHHGDIHKDVRYGLRKGLGGATFFCVGYDYRKAFGVEGVHVPWSEDIPSFHRTLPRYDIGLAPLSPTPFNRAKSELKVIEYQGAGVVPIAQDCPAYRRAIRDGVDGFLVKSGPEWKDRLQLLIHDRGLLSEMKRNARERVGGRLYSENADLWAAAYEQAIG
jgi:glycosyltransferase involved in cell wall biosynthesis